MINFLFESESYFENLVAYIIQFVVSQLQIYGIGLTFSFISSKKFEQDLRIVIL